MADTSYQGVEKTVKFGLGQINNPTPTLAKNIFRTYSFLAGLFALLAPSLSEIPEETMGDITRWLLIGGTVIHFTIKFFGWDYEYTGTK